MDLELATNLIFEGGFLWPTGPPEQAPKSSWRATAFKLCGDAVAASAAAIDTPRGVFAPNSSCERVFVAVAPTRCCACVLRASCAAKLGHAGVV